ncbi:MAG: nucleotide sugar dehydrogenase [Candidatus Omnitrophota bacterium]|nr:nucleotide sugar dehydrogenase [Candidatus Omnitrophota bacterium]
MDKFIKEFKKRVRKKETKIAVVGLGYVGLPLAVEFAKCGFVVLGIDIDKDRINHIKRKESYISDVATKELRRALNSKRFSATANFEALRKIDIIIICVPTPLKRKYHPDISYIKQAVNSIAKNIKKGALIILESTTYPGTTEEVILPLLESKGLECGKDFYLAFSPERIDPGNSKYTVNKIPKVVGGVTAEATELTTVVYRNIIEKVVPVSSARVAEAVKLLENTFRLINIGLIDELAMMYHKMKIDIWEVIEAAKTKPFGFMPFYPGPGVGGHCIPKDPLYLYWKAKHHGFKSRFIKLASDIITYMPEYVTERVINLLQKKGKKLNKIKILVIGVTYKKDIKDLRKSPSLDIIDAFQKNNIAVSYYDPIIPYLKLNHINLKSIGLNKQQLMKFDCVIIAVDHSSLDYKFILDNSKLVFDTRNAYRNFKNSKIVGL